VYLYSSEFEELVQSALKDLDDDSKLGVHPLVQLDLLSEFLSRDKPEASVAERGRALRKILLQSLDQVRRLQAAPASMEGRYFSVLESAFVKRQSSWQVAISLGMSESMYYRIRREAVKTLAAVLADLEAASIRRQTPVK
jgi:DNA-directed RNA polymerase specialized sigma subunit